MAILGRHNDALNEIRALLIAKLMAPFIDTFSHQRNTLYRLQSIYSKRRGLKCVEWSFALKR